MLRNEEAPQAGKLAPFIEPEQTVAFGRRKMNTESCSSESASVSGVGDSVDDDVTEVGDVDPCRRDERYGRHRLTFQR